MKRQQTSAIIQDLEKKIVLLAGPRQAGKTTLAKEIGKRYLNTVYLNYDRLEDREIMKKESWLESTELLILDELHKMPKWKNYLKGIYDTKSKSLRILVTGSARLEMFHKVGDSLAGRYFLHHLLPLSLAELKNVDASVDLDRLLKRGGFPEPYLSENDTDADRWRLQYVDSLLRIDVLEFDNIQNLRSMQLLFELLKTKVGSPISYQSLAEDIGISPNTVKKYIHILETLYIIFRVTPFSKNIARSILKEPKIYFFDNGLINNDNKGLRFENLVAVSLLKHIYSKIDYLGKRYSLHTLRTKENKEIDFAIVHDNKIEKIIEVKFSDANLSSSLSYFSSRYNLPAIQIVKELKRERKENNIEVVRAENFLQQLDL